MPTGKTRVLVLPPVGTNLDLRILGVQFWLADRLKDIGLEGASALFRSPTDASQLIAVEAPTDSEVRATLVEQDARYGLQMSFAEGPQLAVVRLVEARRGHPLRRVARLTFDDEPHLPAAAFRVIVEVAETLRIGEVQSTWSDSFGTSDPNLASSHLVALGAYSVCEFGMVVPQAEVALEAALSGVREGVKPHIELLPHLVERLRSTGSVSEGVLAEAVIAAAGAVEEPPSSWAPMLRRYALGGRPKLVN